ncbi:MAG: flagellar biosynthesis anti-sigma factor FlgM [SAR324 cluster bacterium]|uniref:Flagellar biosynthesis anti-sigma factor FlgM n=1 Tax=SAR324 cluster bacterium TaxID=2024889 RepID=A0A7X9FRJ2_9DELT|nr:flagellar biosynthesis anti-sigma factor FlgM [SAR324 cluster bacterium]
MKIDSISNLISSFAEKYLNSVDQKTVKSEKMTSSAARNSEAAEVSPEFALDENEKSSRKEYLEKIKQEVNAGSYNPDSRDVAEALLRELGSL